jgi:predicted pyridoxine 5'-phosphate oxidase superfamily flavin-nucleotide-binding protein
LDRRDAGHIKTSPAAVQLTTLEMAHQSGACQGEQAVLFQVEAWDANCPQHIPQKFDAADVAAAVAQRDARIAELQAAFHRRYRSRKGVARGRCVEQP